MDQPHPAPDPAHGAGKLDRVLAQLDRFAAQLVRRSGQAGRALGTATTASSASSVPGSRAARQSGKGISTGDFAEALAALLGPDAGGLSASTVARLAEVWADQHAHWLKRDLSAMEARAQLGNGIALDLCEASPLAQLGLRVEVLDATPDEGLTVCLHRGCEHARHLVYTPGLGHLGKDALRHAFQSPHHFGLDERQTARRLPENDRAKVPRRSRRYTHDDEIGDVVEAVLAQQAGDADPGRQRLRFPPDAGLRPSVHVPEQAGGEGLLDLGMLAGPGQQKRNPLSSTDGPLLSQPSGSVSCAAASRLKFDARASRSTSTTPVRRRPPTIHVGYCRMF